MTQQIRKCHVTKKSKPKTPSNELSLGFHENEYGEDS